MSVELVEQIRDLAAKNFDNAGSGENKISLDPVGEASSPDGFSVTEPESSRVASSDGPSDGYGILGRFQVMEGSEAVGLTSAQADPSANTPATMPATIIEATSGDAIEFDGEPWFLSADFARSGSDLEIRGEDGQFTIIENYFTQSTPPDLTTADGVVLKGAIAARLAGSLTPGQYAQSAPGEAASPIGQVETSTGDVKVIRADGTEEKIAEGDQIFLGDILETGADGAIGITLADESNFSLGEDGRVTMDEMIYDPGAQTGSLGVSILQGAFTFVSGQIAKTDPNAMEITTPTATIGIRGTAGGGNIDGAGVTTAALMPEASGFTGEMTIGNGAGSQTINQPLQAVNIASVNAPPTPPFVMTPQQMGQTFGAAMSALPNVAAIAGNVVQGAAAGQAQQQAAEQAAAEAEAQQNQAAAAADAAQSDAEGASAEAAAAEAAAAAAEAAAAEAAAAAQVPGATPEQQAAAEAAAAEAAQAQAQAEAAAAAAAQAQVAAAQAQVDAAQAAAEAAAAQAAVVETSPTGAIAGAALAAGITVPGADDLQAAQAAVQAAEAAVQAAEAQAAQAAAAAGVPLDAGPADGNAPADGGPGDGGPPVDDGGPVPDGAPGPDAGVPLDGLGPNLFAEVFADPLADPFADPFADPLAGPADFFDIAFDPAFDPALDPALDPFLDVPPPDDLPPEEPPADPGFTDFTATSGSITLTDGVDTIVTSGNSTQTVSLVGAAALGDSYDADLVADNLTLDDLGNVLEVNGTFTTLTGGTGSDELDLGFFGATIGNMSGIETVVGGDGTDSITFAGATSGLTLSGGIETVAGSSGTDSVTLGAAGATLSDVSAVETITGGAGIDTVTVSDSTSTNIHGGAGADTLTGGSGNDLITGEAGADILTGGAGNDRFDYTAASESTSAASDTITDFDAVDNTEQIFFEKLQTGTFSFIGASAFSAGSNSEARFDDTTKVLQVDLDGDGTADMEMVLTGVSLADLGAADFKWTGPDLTVTVSGTQSYTLTASQGEIITASASADKISLVGNAESGDSFDGGAGSDELIFATASNNTITVSNTELVTAKEGADNITVGAATTDMVIRAGNGTDSVTLADGTNSVAIINAETITGGTGNDTVRTSISGPSEALTFDGVDDIVNITGATKLATGTGDFTYEAWIRTTEATNREEIISVGDYTTTGAAGYLFVYGGQLRFDLANTQGPTSTVTGGIADGVWHHVAVTNSSGLIQLYVDGETTGPTQTMSPNFTLSTVALGNAVQGGSAFDGELSTVRAWTAARTQAEIQSGMLVSGYSSASGDLTKIAGQWLFNNGTGTTVTDDSGNGYNGTLANQTSGSETWLAGQAGSRLDVTQYTAIDLGAGTDSMSFANGTNTSTISNTETITGGTGNDTITLATAITSGNVDLGVGTDSLTLANGTNSVTVANIETVTGGTGADTVTMSAVASSGDIVDLNGGADSLTLANGTNTLDVRDIETVTGGTGNDTLTISTTGTWNIDLSTGTNSITINSGVSGTYNFTLANVSAINNGSNGADTVTLANSQSGLSVRLGGGGSTDTLNLADGGNTVSVWEDVEIVNGGTGNDDVTAETALSNNYNFYNLGAGTDSVTLASGTNFLTVTGTETVTGNAGADTITVSDGTATTINAAAGNDTLTGGSGADTLTGGSGVDTFVISDATGFGDTITDFLDGGSTSGADVFDLGASISGTSLRGTGASFQTTTTASGTTLGTDTGLLVVSGAVAGLSASVALSEANNLSGGITASDQFYMLASAGTDSTLYRISDGGDGGVWDTAETVATFTGVSDTDLAAIDATSFSDFT